MEFLLLGPLEVREDGREVKVSGRKERALLLALLLRANEPVPRDRLLDELWEEELPDTATSALYVFVSHLRKALGDTVVTRSGGYELRLDPEQIDARQLRSTPTGARGGRWSRSSGSSRPRRCNGSSGRSWRKSRRSRLRRAPHRDGGGRRCPFRPRRSWAGTPSSTSSARCCDETTYASSRSRGPAASARRGWRSRPPAATATSSGTARSSRRSPRSTTPRSSSGRSHTRCCRPRTSRSRRRSRTPSSCSSWTTSSSCSPPPASSRSCSPPRPG